MSDAAAVLFVNEAFYDAFAARDVEAMKMLWSRKAPVTCVHPGWRPLVGRDPVMDSWAAILTNPGAPRISCHNPSAFLLGAVAYVLCYERIEGSFLTATNVFVREESSWRLVHHQAGPASEPPLHAVAEADPPLQ